MGNNQAFSTFQHTVITLYDQGKLDLPLLDALADYYRGTDIDSGGDTGLMSKDGKTLQEICIEVVDPEWVQMILQLPDDQIPYDEDYEKWRSITKNRWGWE